MMNFEIINTPRMILKGISSAHMKLVFDQWQQAEIMKLLGHRSEEEFLKERQKHIDGYAAYNRKFMLFLLIDRETETVIGRCGLHNWNEQHDRAEVGYSMEVLEFRQQGRMTEALGPVLKYGFEQRGLNRIEALAGASNTPSLLLLQRFGFKQEGILRKHYREGDGYSDSLLFSKLSSEWFVDGRI